MERRPVTAEVESSSLFRVVAVFSKFYGVLAQLGEHLPYKQRVIGSSPIGPIDIMDGFPSGQRGQTVNLLATPSKVRILLHPFYIGWCGGIGRRKGLKILREQSRAGSSPATSSISTSCILINTVWYTIYLRFTDSHLFKK